MLHMDQDSALRYSPCALRLPAVGISKFEIVRVWRSRQKRAEPLSDTERTAFLQWALPQLNLRWSGFRKVNRQVCKRLKRRMNDLRVADLATYRTRLEADPAEWGVLDECCHITISRFFREKRVFEVLRARVLPHIAERAQREGRAARMWSAGCASGIKICDWMRHPARLILSSAAM